MKILLIGDASNFHYTLARGVEREGHTVTVASSGSGWMNTGRDIDITRRDGTLGTLHYASRLLRLLSSFRGYDIVQVTNPIFLHLRPGKMRWVFDTLKRNNRHIIYEALGTDYNYVRACLDGTTFRYSDYLVGSEPTPYALAHPDNQEQWLSKAMRDYTCHFTDNVDGITACLYEYYRTYEPLYPEKLSYGGIPVDIPAGPCRIESVPDKVRIFIGVQSARSQLKGTDILLRAAQSVAARHPSLCELIVVENMPLKEYRQRLATAHVLLDQLYSYTPATNALMALAGGIVTVSGAEPEYYRFIGESELQPIVNVTPLDSLEQIERSIESLVVHKERLPELSRQSRAFAARHNATEVVARRHIDFWQSVIDNSTRL